MPKRIPVVEGEPDIRRAQHPSVTVVVLTAAMTAEVRASTPAARRRTNRPIA